MSKIIQMKDADGNVYPQTVAGTVYENAKNVAISAANTIYDGASVTVPAGTYIAYGYWYYAAVSANKRTDTYINIGGQSQTAQISTVLASVRTCVNVACIFTVTANTVVKLQGRSNAASASDGTFIRVVRIA